MDDGREVRVGGCVGKPVAVQTGTLQGRALADRYRVGPRLGAGGMADVYDGRDLRLDRPVAIKVLRPEMAANPDVRRRFEAEARTAARLSHPNVVGVFDTGEDDGVPFIVMERLPGETLADRMARGPVDQAWLRRVAGDVLLALGAAHAAGLVHRDVKPGNILISPEGCAKVADFGIAKTTEPLADEVHTATNLLIGTPSYLAPERIDGAPATPRSDLYAFGVVLYEALAGRKPFSGPNPLAVAHAVRAGDFPPLRDARPDADPRLVAAATRAMARDPQQRFASADDMRAAVEGRTLAAPTIVGPAPGRIDHAATTVIERDHTVVAPATPVPTTVAPLPAMAARSRRSFPTALFLLLLGVLLLLLAALVVARRSSSAGGTATEQQKALATKMKAAADRVRTGDGPKGPEAADRLDTIAGHLDDGRDVKADATGLLGDVTSWAPSGQLSAQAAALVTPLLVEAGAAAPTASTTAAPDTTVAPPTTAAPAAHAGPAPAAPKGHKKKKGD